MKKISINKKYVIWISLVLIIALGIYLRSYHINYPTIGYHNMKEDQYLSYAINMHDSGNYIRTTWFDCSVTSNDYFGESYEKCSGNWGETPPSIWILIGFFGIFGWKIWVARLMIILFSVASILFIYLIIKELSKNEYLALLSSLMYAIIPLSIFFGRNIQMDAPSLFFSLGALYYFIKWFEYDDRKYFLIGGAFFILATMFKMITLIVLFGALFFIPFKKLINLKKYKIEYILIIVMLILAVIWPLFLVKMVIPQAITDANQYSGVTTNTFGKNGWVDTTLSIFSTEYWKNYGTMYKSYINDNYSWLGFWSILIGFSLFILNYKSKLSKFMMGYAIGIIIYIILFAYKLNSHNYYHFPFLPFAAICMANIIVQLGAIIKKITGWKYLQFVPLLLLILVITPFTQSTMQQFNTQFFGQDIAGKYINEHTNKNEIFLLERHIQGEMSWTAQRFYYSIPQDAETLQKIEKEKNLKYIVLNSYGIQVAQNKPSWQYIQNNYHIAQAGFIQTGQGPQLYHLILEKGGIFNLSELNNKPATLATTYELSTIKIPYYIIG